MLSTGLDKISAKIPRYLKGKAVSLLCHAPSINSSYEHIIDILSRSRDLELKSIFGPQHGLFGQTQDNMIEWEGKSHPEYAIPVYSLYGKHRKPAKSMLGDIDAFIIDLQDIGARPYTYIWSMKNVMEACAEVSVPVVILDRPNPISAMGCEGPVLKPEYYTFVGGAEIPLCHNMTIGEIALWLKVYEGIDCELHIEWMDGWKREMMYSDTGLAWVPPSPNMPTERIASVYPGFVLTEALNLSEARGTCTPFELMGAPGLKTRFLVDNLKSRNLPGCDFREHDFIPTFNKYSEQYCNGVYIHITDILTYKPVYTAVSVYDAIMETNPGYLSFNDPPYEYEYKLLPFDILIGDSLTGETLRMRGDICSEEERWKSEIALFHKKFKEISYYK